MVAGPQVREDCWDLVLDGDLTEEAALVQLEQSPLPAAPWGGALASTGVI